MVSPRFNLTSGPIARDLSRRQRSDPLVTIARRARCRGQLLCVATLSVSTALGALSMWLLLLNLGVIAP